MHEGVCLVVLGQACKKARGERNGKDAAGVVEWATIGCPGAAGTEHADKLKQTDLKEQGALTSPPASSVSEGIFLYGAFHLDTSKQSTGQMLLDGLIRGWTAPRGVTGLGLRQFCSQRGLCTGIPTHPT